MAATIISAAEVGRGRTFGARLGFSRIFVYGALILWAFICLFPIYWTLTTSFKVAIDVTQGHLIPWVDFQPAGRVSWTLRKQHL